MAFKTVLACVIAPLVLQILSQACPAATIAVPAQKHLIQSAIDIAAPGDTVLVSPGTYLENLDFKGKAIVVKALPGSQPVIIDGQSLGPVVTFRTGEGRSSVLTGFTIQNGWSENVAPCYSGGGGICVIDASPTIRNNTIINNVAGSEGGGIDVEKGKPSITNNYIGNNKALDSGSEGGGIYLYETGPMQIANNIIVNNSADFGGGIGMYSAGTPTITDNIISGNEGPYEGGGLLSEAYTVPYIIQNLITGNSSYEGAGVAWLVPEGFHGPYFTNNTVADNVGEGIYAGGFDTSALVYNNLVVAGSGQTGVYCDAYNEYIPPYMVDNDVYANGGKSYDGYCSSQTGIMGNITADPLFVAESSGDYDLQPLSPAIDAGDNYAPLLPIGDFDYVPRVLDGNHDGIATVDMGIYEYKPPKPAGSPAATIPLKLPKASRVNLARHSLHRFETVDRNNRRTVQYYDDTGRLVAEVDEHGVFHRMR